MPCYWCQVLVEAPNSGQNCMTLKGFNPSIVNRARSPKRPRESVPASSGLMSAQ